MAVIRLRDGLQSPGEPENRIQPYPLAAIDVENHVPALDRVPAVVGVGGITVHGVHVGLDVRSPWVEEHTLPECGEAAISPWSSPQ